MYDNHIELGPKQTWPGLQSEQNRPKAFLNCLKSGLNIVKTISQLKKKIASLYINKLIWICAYAGLTILNISCSGEKGTLRKKEEIKTLISAKHWCIIWSH